MLSAFTTQGRGKYLDWPSPSELIASIGSFEEDEKLF
jgi:hypothetical protein